MKLIFTYVQKVLIRFLLTIISFSCFLAPSYAKNNKEIIDSLNKELSIRKNDDTTRAWIILRLAEKYPYVDPNKGIILANQALELSKKLNWDNGIVRSYIVLGSNQDSRTAYKDAQSSYTNALTLATQHDDKAMQGVANKYLGIVYYNMGNYPASIEHLLTALTLLKATKMLEHEVVVLEQIGHTYEAQSFYDKAEKYYQLSYESASAAGMNIAKAKNLLNLGELSLMRNRNEEALSYFQRSLAAFESLNDKSGIANCSANIGFILGQLHRYDTSLKMMLGALDVYQSFGDRINCAMVYGNVGKTYYSLITDTTNYAASDSLRNKRKNVEKLFYYLNSGLKLCEETGFLEGLFNIQYYLSLSYSYIGDDKLALEFYKKYVKVKDSLYSEENNVKIANIETKKEVEIKNNELKLKQLELSKKRNESLFFAIGIVLLLISVIVLYRNYYTQKKLNATISALVNEKEQTIQERTKALQETNRKLVSLISFNVHQLREPITRIISLLQLKDQVPEHEFIEDCMPMMEQSVVDLDNKLKEVITVAEEAVKNE